MLPAIARENSLGMTATSSSWTDDGSTAQHPSERLSDQHSDSRTATAHLKTSHSCGVAKALGQTDLLQKGTNAAVRSWHLCDGWCQEVLAVVHFKHLPWI